MRYSAQEADSSSRTVIETVLIIGGLGKPGQVFDCFYWVQWQIHQIDPIRVGVARRRHRQYELPFLLHPLQSIADYFLPMLTICKILSPQLVNFYSFADVCLHGLWLGSTVLPSLILMESHSHYPIPIVGWI